MWHMHVTALAGGYVAGDEDEACIDPARGDDTDRAGRARAAGRTKEAPVDLGRPQGPDGGWNVGPIEHAAIEAGSPMP